MSEYGRDHSFSLDSKCEGAQEYGKCDACKQRKLVEDIVFCLSHKTAICCRCQFTMHKDCNCIFVVDYGVARFNEERDKITKFKDCLEAVHMACENNTEAITASVGSLEGFKKTLQQYVADIVSTDEAVETVKSEDPVARIGSLDAFHDEIEHIRSSALDLVEQLREHILSTVRTLAQAVAQLDGQLMQLKKDDSNDYDKYKIPSSSVSRLSPCDASTNLDMQQTSMQSSSSDLRRSSIGRSPLSNQGDRKRKHQFDDDSSEDDFVTEFKRRRDEERNYQDMFARNEQLTKQLMQCELDINSALRSNQLEKVCHALRQALVIPFNRATLAKTPGFVDTVRQALMLKGEDVLARRVREVAAQVYSMIDV